MHAMAGRHGSLSFAIAVGLDEVGDPSGAKVPPSHWKSSSFVAVSQMCSSFDASHGFGG
jgi:hypothetical protein